MQPEALGCVYQCVYVLEIKGGSRKWTVELVLLDGTKTNQWPKMGRESTRKRTDQGAEQSFLLDEFTQATFVSLCFLSVLTANKHPQDASLMRVLSVAQCFLIVMLDSFF